MHLLQFMSLFTYHYLTKSFFFLTYNSFIRRLIRRWRNFYVCLNTSLSLFIPNTETAVAQHVKAWLFHRLTASSSSFEGSQKCWFSPEGRWFRHLCARSLKGCRKWIQMQNVGHLKTGLWTKQKVSDSSELPPASIKKYTTTFVPILPANYPHQPSLLRRSEPLNGPNLPQQISSHSYPSFRKASRPLPNSFLTWRRKKEKENAYS